jgi:hypothetical protein
VTQNIPFCQRTASFSQYSPSGMTTHVASEGRGVARGLPCPLGHLRHQCLRSSEGLHEMSSAHMPAPKSFSRQPENDPETASLPVRGLPGLSCPSEHQHEALPRAQQSEPGPQDPTATPSFIQQLYLVGLKANHPHSNQTWETQGSDLELSGGSQETTSAQR